MSCGLRPRFARPRPRLTVILEGLDLLSICPGSAKHLPPGFAFAQHLPRICTGVAQDLPKIGSASAKQLPSQSSPEIQLNLRSQLQKVEKVKEHA